MRVRNERWRGAFQALRQYVSSSAKELKQDLSHVRGDYLDLGLHASRLARERDKLAEQLSRAQAYIEALHGEQRPPSGDRDRIGAGTAERLTALEGRLAEAQGRATGLEVELAERTQHIQRLESEEQPLRAELEGLKRGLASVEARRNAVAQERDALASALNVARQEAGAAARQQEERLAALERALAERTWERDEAVHRADSIDQALASARADLELSEEQCAALQVRLDEERASLDEALIETRVRLSDLETARAERERRLEELESRERELGQALAQRDEELTTVRRDHASAKDQNRALAEELGALRRELEDRDRRHAEQLAGERERVRAEAASEAAQFRDQIRHLEEARGVLQQKLNRDQIERNDLEISVLERGQALEAAAAREQELQGRVRELERRLEAASKQQASLAEGRQALLAEIEAVREDYSKTGLRLREEVATLQGRLADEQRGRELLLQRSQDLEMDLGELTARREAAEREINLLQGELAQERKKHQLSQRSLHAITNRQRSTERRLRTLSWASALVLLLIGGAAGLWYVRQGEPALVPLARDPQQPVTPPVNPPLPAPAGNLRSGERAPSISGSQPVSPPIASVSRSLTQQAG